MKNKQIDIYTGVEVIRFLIGEKITENGKATNNSVAKIEESFFRKLVKIHLSNGEVITYRGFPYIIL